jgi:hypothetical protein
VSADGQPEISPPPIPPPKKMEGNYTQINVLFPSSQVELPSAEKFKAFPQEAQKAILEAFKIEQSERHPWLRNQQGNEHALNMQSGRHYFRWRIVGTISGSIILVAALGFGSWLVKNGASGAGVFLMLAAIGTMIGSAIYGHKSSNVPPVKPEEENSEQ